MSIHSVKIGPSFFRKEFNDYANWKWAYAREAIQNCFDAPNTNAVHVTVIKQGGDTLVTFENNGQPMDENILTDKLLALGESGKNFVGSVGGFGKAKVILYLAHKSYTIRTGTFEVRGCGGDYEIIRDLPYLYGTKSEVLIEGDQVDHLVRAFRQFAAFAQWSGDFYVNGEHLHTDLRKGSPRRDLGFGMVYTNKSFPNKIIVRINGVPMFHDYTTFDRCVIVELKGASADVLTSNRDGLCGSARYELSSFITELSVDKRSALKKRGLTRYRRYEGTKLRHNVHKGVNVKALVAGSPGTYLDRSVALVAGTSVGSAGIDLAPGPNSGSVSGVVGSISASNTVFDERTPLARDVHQSVEEDVIFRRTSINEEFIIKNETDLQVPRYYLPDSVEFSTYSQKLVRVWGRLLVELHRLFDFEAEFALGFIFDESAEAEFESGDYGKVYYLNPAKVVEQSSGSKSFKKRFRLTERNRLLMIALHEFVHGFGFGPHDEDYANKLTDMAGRVLDERKRFNWCFA